jgi:phytoene dehydrogenase-like protein
MDDVSQKPPVAVVGGGLAGLAAAAHLARAGRPTVVFERAPQPGGRAVTHETEGFRMNLGPHALYRGCEAMDVLHGLGIEPLGKVPPATGAHAVARGEKHTLPAGLVSLVTTGLLPLPAKLEVARLLAGLARLDPSPLERTSLQEGLPTLVRHSAAQAFVQALVRLTSYADDPLHASAGAALAQLQRALAHGVLYLDGGWQQLVDGLRRAAETAGARVVSDARVAAVEHDEAVEAVRLADGTRVPVSGVILAVPPAEAAGLLGGGARAEVQAWAAAALPVRAACLELGLASLPRPRSLFALGVDRPLYLSVHSATARLAPAGKALVHVAKYLGPGTHDAKADERELEGLLDLVQPGWRTAVVTRRYLPAMTVSHALVTAAGGGLAGRPGPALASLRGCWVAGDWVGAQGMLADASLASARRAAQLALTVPLARAAA